MTQLMDVIEEFLMFRKFSFTRLDGTMSIQLRVDAMTAFNSDPECFLMMISTRAGGLGLNLTSADTVILFDSDWVWLIILKKLFIFYAIYIQFHLKVTREGRATGFRSVRPHLTINQFCCHFQPLP